MKILNKIENRLRNFYVFEAFLQQKSKMQDKYIPINCEFLERLEFWCLKKISCQIVYRQGNFPRDLEIEAIITDIFSRDKAEFISLNNGEEIRLDRIVSVNAYELPKNSCRIG